jgi:chromosome segregation ATPase
MKAAVAILTILVLGLAAVLFYRHNQAIDEQQKQTAIILQISNDVTETRATLDDEQKLSTKLRDDLNQRAKELETTSNDLIKARAELANTQKEALAAAEAAKREMAARDQKINELEGERSDLTKKMDDLMLNIDALTKQISDTERKLAASEGDREFLLKELKRLQTEKAELERQFNDLKELRSQIAKLKDELSVSKRLEWIRSSIYGSSDKRGADMILEADKTTGAKPSYDLNVELRQDGSATVVTNPPPAPAPR